MITSLRHKFIAIAMCSITLVLTIILGGINIANYINVCTNADFRIHLISDNGGTFPQSTQDKLPPAPPQTHADKNEPAEDTTAHSSVIRQMSPEAAFDTRYFTVTVLEDGTISQIDTGRIAAASTLDASNYAHTLWLQQKTHGFIDCYRYQAVVTTTDSGIPATMYIFLNCERELTTFQSFLIASIGISIVGLLLVFILVLFFSRWALSPVAQSYEKQKQFITDASHEIKTPLTIIDANTEVLELTNGENQWTKSTRKQVARLSALTEKLVFLSRMDESNVRLEMQSFDFSNAIWETAEPFETLAKTSGKHLKLDIVPNITIQGNEAALRQLVSLLLDNALKYSPAHGSILLSFRSSGKNKVLTVWNTTEYISPGKHEELFERFYRPDSSRNSTTGGHGIGLSVAKAITTAHKGKIAAHSRDGNSLTFTVTL